MLNCAALLKVYFCYVFLVRLRCHNHKLIWSLQVFSSVWFSLMKISSTFYSSEIDLLQSKLNWFFCIVVIHSEHSHTLHFIWSQTTEGCIRANAIQVSLIAVGFLVYCKRSLYIRRHICTQTSPVFLSFQDLHVEQCSRLHPRTAHQSHHIIKASSGNWTLAYQNNTLCIRFCKHLLCVFVRVPSEREREYMWRGICGSYDVE